MANKVMSAPLAIIKSNGVAIGKMRNVRCSESTPYQMVKGIGKIRGGEPVLTDWKGTLNCGAFTMDLRQSIIPGAIPRVAQTPQQWEDAMILKDQGVQLVILRKVLKTQLPSGLVTVEYVPFVTIDNLFATREDWDITEGQVSGRNADFEYTDPILFPI
jgi:hypothetical protein